MTKKSRDRRGLLRFARSQKYYGEIILMNVNELKDLFPQLNIEDLPIKWVQPIENKTGYSSYEETTKAYIDITSRVEIPLHLIGKPHHNHIPIFNQEIINAIIQNKDI